MLPTQVFAGLAGLRSLRLSGNNLAALPEGTFAGLAGLERLDLRNNALTALSEGDFDGLSSLQSLNVEDNPGSPFELRNFAIREGSSQTLGEHRSMLVRFLTETWRI